MEVRTVCLKIAEFNIAT